MSIQTPGPFKAVQIIIENSPPVWAIQRKNIREQWGKPSLATYINNDADARLFAAAPELLDALKRLLDTPKKLTKLEHFDYMNNAERMARAVIRKVEGGVE